MFLWNNWLYPFCWDQKFFFNNIDNGRLIDRFQPWRRHHQHQRNWWVAMGSMLVQLVSTFHHAAFGVFCSHVVLHYTCFAFSILHWNRLILFFLGFFFFVLPFFQCSLLRVGIQLFFSYIQVCLWCYEWRLLRKWSELSDRSQIYSNSFCPAVPRCNIPTNDGKMYGLSVVETNWELLQYFQIF